MELGLFLMPAHPPERSLYDATQWDLELIQLADELGYVEAWVGEHFTVPWEPICAPDLLLAQALLRTKSIKLAPGAHLLPYHHPVELAHRVAYFDHLAQGRFMLGVGASGIPGDWALFDVDGQNGEHREMTREALEIMLKVWTENGPWEFRGKYWNANGIAPMFEGLMKRHIKPFQAPHPPIGVTGFSAGSETLKLAGERGYLPMSLDLNTEYVATHWDAVLEGAARSGRVPDRQDWRLVREVVVAETDEQAFRYAVDGMIGRNMREYVLPTFRMFGMTKFYKHNPTVPDGDVTPEYLAENTFVVGSVETVVDKLEATYDQVGGFGHLLILGFDYSDNPGPWKDSMRLLAEEVMPRLNARIAKKPSIAIA
ncbi:alkane 1-monooxygenase [Mycolicibacterium elephantis]|uniref:LLM class flavin-dependent oxidoreductase n=1 Tax=Mycolicibacterium elephantis TaxID=81858 RepID=UPI0007EC11D4|nr:LLM class flavin-dependent oxidoreductase [Mycolicibacterium elephantis]OBA66060.1 alkane 1-monooxygenase [Mycolicibacterium elephantis]